MHFELRIEIIAASQLSSERGLVSNQFEAVDPTHTVFGADE